VETYFRQIFFVVSEHLGHLELCGRVDDFDGERSTPVLSAPPVPVGSTLSDGVRLGKNFPVSKEFSDRDRTAQWLEMVVSREVV